MTCRLCDNPATYRGFDGDPDDAATDTILVCGQHSLAGDERIAR